MIVERIAAKWVEILVLNLDFVIILEKCKKSLKKGRESFGVCEKVRTFATQ